jgi:hypothetical protein
MFLKNHPVHSSDEIYILYIFNSKEKFTEGFLCRALQKQYWLNSRKKKSLLI